MLWTCHQTGRVEDGLFGSWASDLWHDPLIHETSADEAFLNCWFSVLGPSLTQSGAAGCNGANREAAQIRPTLHRLSILTWLAHLSTNGDATIYAGKCREKWRKMMVEELWGRVFVIRPQDVRSKESAEFCRTKKANALLSEGLKSWCIRGGARPWLRSWPPQDV